MIISLAPHQRTDPGGDIEDDRKDQHIGLTEPMHPCRENTAHGKERDQRIRKQHAGQQKAKQPGG